jgi:beta-xylosidase
MKFKRDKTMKKILAIVLLPLLLGGMIACTDVQGDGMGTVIWQGSTVPQDSSFRNPVWEPDLSYSSVYKAAVGFYAIGADKEWSPGLNLTAPVLSSTDLMSWDQRGEALAEKPVWSGSLISAISAGFAKTKGTYYLFYELGNDGIGMGSSKAPQGPFVDYGLLIDSESTGLAKCTKPFFYAFGSKSYLFYQGGDGIYGQELILDKTGIGQLKGDKFKVCGSAIESINMIKLDDYFYLFGAVEDGDASRLTVARSLEVSGPFLDEDGNTLMNGEGTLLLKGNAAKGFVAVDHIAGVFQDANQNLWVAHQATDVDIPTLSSGAPRHPLVISKIEFDESGWPTQVFEAAKGWNYPKFAK